MKPNSTALGRLSALLLLAIAIAPTFSVFAQEQQPPQPTEHQFRDTTSGKLYWNRHKPLYLFVGATPDPASAHLLKSRKQAQWGTPFRLDTEGVNYIRTRWAVDPATGRTIQPKQEILWEVYADGIAPRTTIQTHAEAKAVHPKTKAKLLGRNARITLTAKDAVSGVQSIHYAINGKPYQLYTGQIPLPDEGKVSIAYLATDRVGNQEKLHTLKLTVDTTPPATRAIAVGVNVGKDNTLSKNTALVLEATDPIAGVAATRYRIDSGQWRRYPPRTRISLQKVKGGQHRLEFYSTDRVANREAMQHFDFFLDDTAPITISDILGDKFIVGNKTFFSGRTKMKITSVDNHAGVKDVLYSIDSQPFTSYTDPFYMPQKPGWHTVRYYAIDSTENQTEGARASRFYEYRMKVDRIYVDLTGPTISHSLVGKTYRRNDTVFVAPTTRITLKGHDPESGLRNLAYSLDQDAWEKNYGGPFDLEGIPSGQHQMEYFGYDNVGNRNIASFSFILDSDPPEVDYSISVKPYENQQDAEGQPIYPKDARVFLTGQDNMTGVSKLEYSLNGRPYRLYKGAFGGLERGTNRLKIRATDYVGNTHEKMRKISVR